MANTTTNTFIQRLFVFLGLTLIIIQFAESPQSLEFGVIFAAVILTEPVRQILVVLINRTFIKNVLTCFTLFYVISEVIHHLNKKQVNSSEAIVSLRSDSHRALNIGVFHLDFHQTLRNFTKSAAASKIQKRRLKNSTIPVPTKNKSHLFINYSNSIASTPEFQPLLWGVKANRLSSSDEKQTRCLENSNLPSPVPTKSQGLVEYSIAPTPECQPLDIYWGTEADSSSSVDENQTRQIENSTIDYSIAPTPECQPLDIWALDDEKSNHSESKENAWNYAKWALTATVVYKAWTDPVVRQAMIKTLLIEAVGIVGSKIGI
jgi:hypothetical protein